MENSMTRIPIKRTKLLKKESCTEQGSFESEY